MPAQYVRFFMHPIPRFWPVSLFFILFSFFLFVVQNLSRVSVSLPHLTDFALAHCHAVTAVSLSAPVLTALAIESCNKLTSVHVTAPLLQRLVLFGCRSLAYIKMTKCHSLETLYAVSYYLETLEVSQWRCNARNGGRTWIRDLC